LAINLKPANLRPSTLPLILGLLPLELSICHLRSVRRTRFRPLLS
jgi:hypothetical protein